MGPLLRASMVGTDCTHVHNWCHPIPDEHPLRCRTLNAAGVATALRRMVPCLPFQALGIETGRRRTSPATQIMLRTPSPIQAPRALRKHGSQAIRQTMIRQGPRTSTQSRCNPPPPPPPTPSTGMAEITKINGANGEALVAEMMTK